LAELVAAKMIANEAKQPENAREVRKVKVSIAQVFVGSNGAAAFYEDTGQPVRVNKTAWKVTIVDNYGCEEVFYFQSEEAAREFASEVTGEHFAEEDEGC
jgi:nitrous oxide reductase accessory protein NosL